MTEGEYFTTVQYAPSKASGSTLPFPLKWHGEEDDTPIREWLVEKRLPKVGKACS
jgi:hypothetical protein